ncbi:MAG: hydroxymethylglutaryl-CoA lyase [Spiribacter salinus]|uniref:Hydroxymethylglutaryl-CoA lyase n=1 Tax=Spiribacter salinus TaxID=1335746 RepID=A0A540VV42_9GAMM|nr:MAG: hydroxymethylglutaryl-CoA lyase [Spiribacter salinus]
MNTNVVVINEVGLRDGLQNQHTQVSTAGKCQLAELLVEAGLRHMEATSFVSPKAVPQMADAAELMAILPKQSDVEYAALIPNERGYERAINEGVRSVNVALSATDEMNRNNIRMSLDETRAVCQRIIARATADGVTARGYVAVAYECPFEGAVPFERVVRLVDEMFESGADQVIIADTIGAAAPTAVYERFTALASRFDINRLSAHFHDTRALALANCWAALQTGVRRFDSSIGGLGGCPFAPGAAGNVATEDLVLMLEQCGYSTGIDVTRLLAAVRLAEELTERELGGRMLPWLLTRNKACSGA